MFLYNYSFELLVQMQLISWIDAKVKFLNSYVNNACSRGIYQQLNLLEYLYNLENVVFYDQMINIDIAWPKSIKGWLTYVVTFFFFNSEISIFQVNKTL